MASPTGEKTSDLYEILEVSSDADVVMIEKAFGTMSLKHHPDKANPRTVPQDREESESEKKARERGNHERYLQITKARDTLSDPSRRRAYDRERKRERERANANTNTTSRSSSSRNNNNNNNNSSGFGHSHSGNYTNANEDIPQIPMAQVESRLKTLGERIDEDMASVLSKWPVAGEKLIGSKTLRDIVQDAFQDMRSANQEGMRMYARADRCSRRMESSLTLA